MSKQVSVKIDDDVNKHIQKVQLEFKKEYGESLSFSVVLNEIIRNLIR